MYRISNSGIVNSVIGQQQHNPGVAMKFMELCMELELKQIGVICMGNLVEFLAIS